MSLHPLEVHATAAAGLPGFRFRRAKKPLPPSLHKRATKTPTHIRVLGVALLAALSGCLNSGPAPGDTCQPNSERCDTPPPPDDAGTPQTWSVSGRLTTIRDDTTATLLPSGKVLVTGGSGFGDSPFATAEVYDPGTGTWSSTGSLATRRQNHTATRLSSGKVLVAGGYIASAGQEQFISAAEVYDPETGTWSSTGGLATGRARHTATLLLSGKVLVVGGVGQTRATSETAEVYDPETGTWSSTSGLTGYYEGGHTATRLASGKVLVASGAFFTVELYDPETDTWSRTEGLDQPYGSHTATLLPSGKVLMAGGFGTRTAKVYDPETGTWSRTGGLITERYFARATLLPSGKVLLAGGRPFATELYDPETGTWSPTGELAFGFDTATATLLLSGKVLIAGGSQAKTELYTP